METCSLAHVLVQAQAAYFFPSIAAHVRPRGGHCSLHHSAVHDWMDHVDASEDQMTAGG